MITPNIGLIYTGGKKKAEHGGFAHDDTNVTMLFSNPGLRRNIVTSRVETAESRLPSWTPFI